MGLKQTPPQTKQNKQGPNQWIKVKIISRLLKIHLSLIKNTWILAGSVSTWSIDTDPHVVLFVLNVVLRAKP